MRLFELVYCCRLYAEGTDYDVALARFRGRVGATVDLENGQHRAALLQWLRDWGCRHMAARDDERSSDALREWWEDWGEVFPGPDVLLDALSENDLQAASDAYAELADRIGPRRQWQGELTDVRFGPATAAKAMFATRPRAFVPWDDEIRKRLGFGVDADSYRRALTRAIDELTEACEQAGVSPEQLPAFDAGPIRSRTSWSMSTIGCGSR